MNLRRYLLFLVATPFRPKIGYRNDFSNYNYSFPMWNDNTMYPDAPTMKTNYNGFALDVNCKTGDTTENLSMRYPKLKVLGIEKNKNMVKLAQKKYKYDFININFEEEKQIIPPESFKVVQVSNYDHLFISYQKALSILEYKGIMIFRCQDDRHLELLVNYISSNQNIVHENIYSLRTQYLVHEKTLFVCK